MGDRPAVTVLTPSYNRAHTLPRLYRSLGEQTFTDFEWLVVDDGSTDETVALLEAWAREAPFRVRWHSQPNAGRNVATNRGVERAAGELCAGIGSDDWYVSSALERMVGHWRALPATERAAFANVEGLCAAPDGTLRSARLPTDVFDSDNFELTYLIGAGGDRVGMYRTEVLRAFPFPEDLGRKAETDALVFNRIAQRYRSRFVNEVWAYVDYSPDGMSSQGLAERMISSRAQLELYRELLASGKPVSRGWYARAHANLVRHSLHNRLPVRDQLAASRSPLAWAAAVPVGAVLAARDRWALQRLGRARPSGGVADGDGPGHP